MDHLNFRVSQTYLLLLALSSVGIPIGGYYIKMDWLGALVLGSYGILLFIISGLDRRTISYFVVFLGYLLGQGIYLALVVEGRFDEVHYISYFLQFALALGVFVVIGSLRFHVPEVKNILSLWVFIGCMASILAIIQWALNDLIIGSFLYIPYYADNTIAHKEVYDVLATTAWFAEASWFGSFLVVPTVYVIFRLSQPCRSRHSSLPWLLAAVLLLVGNLLNYSLTATIAILVGVVVIVFSAGTVRVWVTIALAGSAIVLLNVLEVPQVVLQAQRFSEIASNLLDFQPGSDAYGRSTSFYERSVGFSAGFDAFLRNPIFGQGLGQSPMLYHSGLLTLLAELGVIGAVLYFALPFLAVWRLLRLVRNTKGEARLLALALLACLFADYANGLVTHNAFHLQRWFLVAITYSWLWGMGRRSEARHNGRLMMAV